MPKDTLTLALKGDVPLSEFAEAIKYFSILIDALSEEIAGEGIIEWEISRLEAGSALASITGQAIELENVERVIYAYEVLGESLAEGKAAPFSDNILFPAKALTGVINGKITAINFITDDLESSVTRSLLSEELMVEEEEGTGQVYSLGAITGTVDTLARRGGLKFTLYDDLFDKAIYCYLDRDKQEMIRDAWGKRVRVIGFIHRDQETGKAQKVSNIKRVDILSDKDVPIGTYKQARGVIPWQKGDEPSETIIRRLRDAI